MALMDLKDIIKDFISMKQTVKFLIPLTTLVLLAACSPRVDYRGKAPEAKDIAKVQVGVSTTYDVLTAIGSPTFESTYAPKTWFYIHKKTETMSFFKPNITEKNTLAVTFTDKGVVQKVEDMDPETQNINPVTHTTPTVGSDRTILQQVFSNFGRTAKKTDKK